MEIKTEAKGAKTLEAELRAPYRDVSPCAALEDAGERMAAPIDQPAEIVSLLLRWQATALADPRHPLPPFEELALGSFGDLADDIALVRPGTGEGLVVFRVGRRFEGWIRARDTTIEITPRSTGRARVLHEAVAEALAEGRPVQKIAHALVNFVVCSDDIVALPLANRWGPPLCLVYVRERDRACNLLECLFKATPEGQVALVLARGKDGVPRDFQILALNDGAAALLQQPADELTGQRLGEVAFSLGEPSVISRLLDVVASGENARFELDQETADGDVVHLNVGAAPLGEFVVLTLSNIGDVKRREASFRMLFKNNPVPMWLCDPSGQTILAVNDAATALYGYDRSAFIGLRVCDIVSCEACRDLCSRAADGTRPTSFEQIERHIKADGSKIDVHIYGRDIVFEGVVANLVTIVDITEQRRAEARIEHMAHHDALTGLPNRALFTEELARTLQANLASGRPLAVLYLDLDDFKNVNDTLGHPIGDQLLRAVGQRLQDVLRQTDFVARLGGDEFAIVQADLETPADTGRLACRIVESLNAPFEIERYHVTIGVSVGIAIAPNDGNSAPVLLRNADIALYRAKEQGRRTFAHFSPELHTRILARSVIEGTLQEALAKGEFELFFQPLVEIDSGAINGFEALLRWRHPNRGLVGPSEFIPLAEKTGLIVPLGEWALRHACFEARSWPDPLKVTVNLSAVQFKFGNLHKTVLQALVDSGLPPHRLDLEITETVLLAESDTVLATLHKLRDLGVGVSMDDFGTGYSCLTYLRTFPFTKIKIDKSFVDEIATGAQSTAIVRAVAALGTSLGMAITAEGVETREQLEWLRKEGCTEIQGYYFSPPLPASEVHAMVEKKRLGFRQDGETASSAHAA